VIEDLDVSGSDNGKRLDGPGLRKIRQRWDEFDVIIFAKLDRLARNVIDFRAFAEEAAEHGAALVSVDESLDLTSPSGKFVATILAAGSQHEARPGSPPPAGTRPSGIPARATLRPA
jgi:site-specific DNA recombinase